MAICRFPRLAALGSWVKSWYIGAPPWIKLRVAHVQRGYKVEIDMTATQGGGSIGDIHIDCVVLTFFFLQTSHWHQLREVGVL